MNVWLIDDSETDVVYGQIVLECARPGASVRAFESGLDALAELKKPGAAWPQAILLDINMPRMSGFEFLDAFEALAAEQRTQTRLLMVSSSPLEADCARARHYRCVQGYLTKPIDAEQVARALEGEAVWP